MGAADTMRARISGRRYLVTGGTGFIGSALVRGLLERGAIVRSLDNDSRGHQRRLADVAGRVEMRVGDVRDPGVVREAMYGVDAVCHCAYINGTEFFYSKPDLVLEVAVKGMMNVLDACASEHVQELVLISSSEVYQEAPVVPTPESVPLVVPDLLNPRYSYGGGKIISELLAVNYARERLGRVLIVRPHNVYGPDMGYEHVIPQFAGRLAALPPAGETPVAFPIQGTGAETRAFIHVDDFTEGLLVVIERGAHGTVYNIGTSREVTIAELAHLAAGSLGRRIDVVPGALQPGSTPRRAPDVGRLEQLGFQPRTSLEDGVARTVAWYRDHPHPGASRA